MYDHHRLCIASPGLPELAVVAPARWCVLGTLREFEKTKTRSETVSDLVFRLWS